MTLDQLLGSAGIVDDGLDLAPMPDDPLVLHQPINITLGVTSDSIEIETVKSRSKVLALGEDGSPAQARLEAFQAEFLEETEIIAHRESPFGVVIVEKLRCGCAPTAPGLAVRSQYGGVHALRPGSTRPVSSPAARASSRNRNTRR